MAAIPNHLGLLEGARAEITNSSHGDRAHFLQLWALHTQALANNVVLFYIPRNIVNMFNQGITLQSIARDVCNLTCQSTFITFDFMRDAFRIGNAPDLEHEYPQAVFNDFTYCAEDTQPRAEPLANSAPQNANNDPANDPANATSNVLDLEAAQILHLEGFEAAGPSRRRGVNKIPKPRNKWILYRGEKHHRVVAEYPEMPTAQVSKVIAEMWKAEPENVKNHYQRMADQEKEAHNQMFPGYRCAPRKSSEIKRRKTANALGTAAGDVAGLVHDDATDANLGDKRGGVVRSAVNRAIAQPLELAPALAQDSAKARRQFMIQHNVRAFRARAAHLHRQAKAQAAAPGRALNAFHQALLPPHLQAFENQDAWLHGRFRQPAPIQPEIGDVHEDYYIAHRCLI